MQGVSSNNNLFNSEWTTGDLSSIQWFVRIGQWASVCVISIIGFAITISTVCKQAIHGLYATNTQFWDKVDEVHRMKLVDKAKGIGKEGNEIAALLGFGQTLFFSIMPNIKPITEFDGDNIDVKTFFTKSLPVACLHLFIGVFIFYGYTTKLGEKVSMFGTTVLDNYFLNVDPIAWAEKIPGKIAKIELATDNSKLGFDQYVNKLARQCISSVFSAADDVEDKERKLNTALAVEQWVIDELMTISEYVNPDAYDMVYTVKTLSKEKDASRTHGVVTTIDDVKVATFCFQTQLSTFDTGTVKESVPGMYLICDLTFTEKAQKADITSVECAMTGGTVKATAKNFEVTLDVDSTVATLIASNAVGVADDGTKLKITVSGTKLILEPYMSSNLPSSVTALSDITGLSYKANGGGTTNKVSSIKFGGSTVSFSSVNVANVADWVWGEFPKSGSNKTSNDEVENDNDTEDDGDGDSFSNN